MKLKTVSLDLGDTLIYNEPWGYQVISDALKDLGYTVPAKELFRASARVRGRKVKPNPNGNNTPSLEEIFRELGLSLSEDEVRLVEERRKSTEKGVFIYDDVIEFLEAVKSLGLTTVLISNAAMNGKGKRYLEDFGLKKYFDRTIFSFEVGRVKPDPEIFKLAIPEGRDKAIHVGDIYEVDVLGALNAGLKGVLLDRRRAYDEVDGRLFSLRDLLDLIESEEVVLK